MLLLVSVYLIILFDHCPSFRSPSFLFGCVAHSLSLPLSSCLGYLALLIWLPFLRSLLRRMFFLPCAYYMWFSFVCLFCFCLSFVSSFSLLSLSWRRCTLQATFTSASFCLFTMFCFVLFCFLRPCSFPFCFDFSDRVRSRFVSVWLRPSRDHSWIEYS